MLKVKEISFGWEPNVEEQSLSSGTKVWFASHPELLGIDGSGTTAEEARERFEENRLFYWAHLAKHNLPMPIATHVFVRLESGPNVAPQGFDLSTESESRTTAPRNETLLPTIG